LYVDDDLTIARLVKRIFESKYPTFEILVAASAADATDQLHHLAGQHNFPKALVTDVRLGGTKDGPALVEDLRHEFPKLRMIVVSSIRDPKDVLRARTAGAHAFVEKGLSIPGFVNELVDLIQSPTEILGRMADAPQPHQ
ncbi:MAG TPA: response regulator, partial [Candidatus Acidoferrum sp.]|nr:response regulator [Candidatus Acidoferrum sp.]